MSPGLASRVLRRHNSIAREQNFADNLTRKKNLAQQFNSQQRHHQHGESEDEKEADFHEINLSLPSPYKDDDLNIQDPTPNFASLSHNANVVNAADRDNFARGLENLPKPKRRVSQKKRESTN